MMQVHAYTAEQQTLPYDCFLLQGLFDSFHTSDSLQNKKQHFEVGLFLLVFSGLLTCVVWLSAAPSCHGATLPGREKRILPSLTISSDTKVTLMRTVAPGGRLPTLMVNTSCSEHTKITSQPVSKQSSIAGRAILGTEHFWNQRFPTFPQRFPTPHYTLCIDLKIG